MLRRVVVVLVVVLGVVGVAVSPALGAGDANVASCGNEALTGFESFLPDCRAYEMVSPAFKDGNQVIPIGVSGDGSRVIGYSLGAFAGTESDPFDELFGAVYELSRSGSGWVTSAITPPASVSSNAVFWGASADLGRTLWLVRGVSGSLRSEEIAVREEDGSLARVGSVFPPGYSAGPPAGSNNELVEGSFRTEYFEGASSDLSHVLFGIGAGSLEKHWPGDTTAPSTKQSLYEYVGTGNGQPRLVGVDAEGHLISDCGIYLGADSEIARNHFNAVSVSGETVFFTAVGHSNSSCAARAPEVSELYARLNEVETVAISEPTESQCAGCQTTVREPAVFQGASADGSKVFFLTEQELLGGASTMNVYEYDFDNSRGAKIVRVSVGSSAPEVQGVVRVSSDGSHVYFVAKAALTGPNGEGNAPVVGGENLYVFERDAAYPGGRTAFVATLSEEDGRAWEGGAQKPVQVTPDGRFLVFPSVADLTPGDTSSERQVFEYDALAERLVRVSVGAVGYAAGSASADEHASSIAVQPYDAIGQSMAATTGLAVSSDGSVVIFGSEGALTPGAVAAAAAGADSVYEYRSAGSITNGNVYLISDGTNTASAEAVGLDASGGDVFVETADPLLAGDGDTQFDLYDARVGGGFPAAAAPAVCAGDVCQGALSGATLFDVAGSVSRQAGGNLAAPVETVSSPKPKAKQKSKKPKGKAKHKRRGRAKHKSKIRKSNVNVKGRG